MNLIIAIIVGGIAGWIAERLMKSEHGLFLNVVLGMAGAFVAGIAFGFLGVSFEGTAGYLVAGVLGACLLIFLGRGIRGRSG